MAKVKTTVAISNEQVRATFNTFVRLGLLSNDRKSFNQFTHRIRSREAYDETNLDVYRGGYNGVSAAIYMDETNSRVEVIVRNSLETVHTPQLAARVTNYNNKLKTIFG